MNFSIQKKFQIFNTLFQNLSYEGANDFGQFIQILGSIAHQKLKEGQNPVDVFNSFYDKYGEMIKDDKISFMFKVVQFVERQIVLFDSIEDSISPYDLDDQKSFLIDSMMANNRSDEARHDLYEKLNKFSVRIVLTAHPTQFYRPQVLGIIARLRASVKKGSIEKIDTLLHQLGLTSLVNKESPTPLEEAKNIIHICRYEYYDAIGNFIYELNSKYPSIDNENLLMLGFWPCGDRDGNFYVTHKVTREVIDALRMTLMKCYYNEIKDLKTKLTFRELDILLEQVQDKLYEAMFNKEKKVNYKWLLNSLEEIRAELIEKYHSLYLRNLDLLITKVKVFKEHFASLDIRQDNSVHKETVEKILLKNGMIQSSLDELSEDELISLLTEKNIEIPEVSQFDELVMDTIKNIEQLPTLQKMNGELGCHRYIISNSEDIFSVLFVYGLFRWIHKTDIILFDIIPLFETIKGMQASEQVMKKLYELERYNNHLERRNKKQTIMLGFSDGTKDGGYLKANWAIYQCKETLAKLSKKYAINAIFFDGRGGPPARGGGKTHNFYAAHSEDIAGNDIQLTIQGQTITSTYGTKEKFAFNAEQMITSGLTSLKSKSRTTILTEQRKLLEELSELSYTKYMELKNHPNFIPYLEKMTTLKFYSKAKIGSRPGKRNKSKKLTLKDLRAISYVGSWSQLKQNIPGFYGVGTALKNKIDNGELEALQNLYKQSPLFKTLMDNCMMSLTKCLFSLTTYMKNDSEFGEFWQILYDEYKLSKSLIMKVAQMSILMENEPISKKSIKIRDEIVRPLLLVQHYALQMLNLNKDPKNKELYEKLVIRSLYGNINASRNSA